MEHLLPDARGCHLPWAMMAEVVRWGTPICLEVGVSYLMSAVTLSYGLHLLMSARMGMCFAHHLFFVVVVFFLKRLWFSDTDEVTYRNAHLSHYIWYSNAYFLNNSDIFYSSDPL